ncbi:MAG: tRNA lysidine(34) synthetase TilS [Planctomycetaceae bacterium]|nr:tRNA lysidine(34) synthetase TilS [Planctomycetaceae bacterium]
MQTIEKKVEIFIRQKNLMPADGKILLAVSGGADSVALLCILHKLFPGNLHIAHINHQLRGTDSLNDEYYVRQLAEKYKLPVTTKLVDVNTFAKKQKLSIETAARQLRLEALTKIADKHNCTAIATAHHKNDNVETVIQRILRGTGYKGLAGIRAKTVFNEKTFVRPLLCLSRDEIEKYLKTQNILWQNDYTNTDTRFTRNRIRHKLLPYLMEESPGIVETLNDLADKCERLNSNIKNLCEAAAVDCFIAQNKKQITIDILKFTNLPKPVQVELIQKALTQIKCGLQKYTFEHYKKIIDFISSAKAGKNLAIPGKINITKGYDKFFIGTSKIKDDEVGSVTLNLPGKTVFENYIIETEILKNTGIKNIKNSNNLVEFFNFEQITPPLTVRCRQKGDKFKPFGQNSLKKVGKFLTTEKIDVEQKNKTFIICDNDSIIWVAPIRRSNKAIIDSNALKTLKITISYIH